MRQMADLVNNRRTNGQMKLVLYQFLLSALLQRVKSEIMGRFTESFEADQCLNYRKAWSWRDSMQPLVYFSSINHVTGAGGRPVPKMHHLI